MQRKVFNKNIEISVQEIMKSAIIPLKSFRIPEIIIVKFDEQEKKKEERVILNLSSSKSLMFSCYILIWLLKLFSNCNISKLYF